MPGEPPDLLLLQAHGEGVPRVHDGLWGMKVLRRHRYAEKTFVELERLKEERRKIMECFFLYHSTDVSLLSCISKMNLKKNKM